MVENMKYIIEAIIRGIFMLMVAVFLPFVMYGMINPEYIHVMGEYILELFS